jgi:hypothetical protein
MKAQENSQQATYTLLFPFELKSGEALTDLLVDRKLGNLSLTLERQSHKYVLRVEGFKSEQEARDYVNHLWAAFAWLLVNANDGMPFNASLEFGHAYYPPDPKIAAENVAWAYGGTVKEGEVIDVSMDGDLPSVYRTDQKIKRTFGGKVRFKRTRNVENFVSTLEQLSTTDISSIVKQPKLKLALELYNAFFYEKSDNAKFITLIMVLEALTTEPEKHKVALELIDKWREELNTERGKYDSNTTQHESLTALERELLFRRKASLTSQIRVVVIDALDAEDSGKALDYAKQSVKSYNLRSTLVHEGSLSPNLLSSTIEKTKIVVQEVLKAKLLEVIK